MSEIPRSFRRESRLFLWIALLLILFLNFATLLFFREAVDWGSAMVERRAAEVLRRASVATDMVDALEAFGIKRRGRASRKLSEIRNEMRLIVIPARECDIDPFRVPLHRSEDALKT